jgi:putative SbcD/Mre11-related phosphoesterase
LTQIKLFQPYPALILEERSKRALVICDLHLGWEKHLSTKGVHIPSQTPKIKKLLLDLIKEIAPSQLIILGDIKDAITRVSMEDWKDIPEFFEDLQEKISDIQIIPGNHDGNLEPLLPEKVKIVSSSGISFRDVGLFHGHSWPAPELLGCRSMITGHVHPMLSIRDPMGFRIMKQIFVKAKCESEKLAKAYIKYLGSKNINDVFRFFQINYGVKVKVKDLFILPSFNQFLGGSPINQIKKGKKNSELYINPILRSGCVNLDNAEVYLLDGTFLGTVDRLKALG